MSAHQSHACCTVPPVVAKGYENKGTFEQIDGKKTYLTGSKTAKSAILYIFDIFGYFPQTLQGADILANGDKENTHLVVMPDWFNDKPFPHDEFPPKTEAAQKKLGQFFETTANPGETAKSVPAFVDAVRAKYPSIETFFVAGFCWGGKIAALASQSGTKFKAAAAAHPAMVDPEEGPKITIPFALLPSKDEDMDAVNKFKSSLKVKGLVEEFPTQQHGWMAARADLEDEKVAKEYQRGYQTMLNFFHEAL